MFGEAEYQRGIAAFEVRRIRESLMYLDLAERFGYNPNECAGTRWYCWMLLGEFERAWDESDAILSRGFPDPGRLWDGKPFRGQRVIIRCLHGFGDAIQFLRYTSLMRAEGARVIAETHPEMVELLTRLKCVDEVVTWGDGSSPKFRDWDQQVEVMELPYIFRTTVQTIPQEVPYIAIDAAAKKRSADMLGGSCRRKVGLLWGSGEWNPSRSVPFDEFRRIAETDGISFYSFQRGMQKGELYGAGLESQVFDTSLHSAGIHDTAADLLNMDLLITVDTMAAHLAGALGCAVWMLLPWDADWRWMLDREDSPWYPTMRLFRQPSPGDWASVVDRILREIEGWKGCPLQ